MGHQTSGWLAGGRWAGKGVVGGGGGEKRADEVPGRLVVCGLVLSAELLHMAG